MKKLILGTLLVSATSLMADGAALYQKCAGCHGVNADKKALGASKVIKGWDSAKIVEALNGYKAGNGEGMYGNIMNQQAKNLSSAEIKALADYISKK